MNLADVLSRATDRIEPAGRGALALAHARRRRSGRRAAAVASTVLATVAAIGAGQMLEGNGGTRPGGPPVATVAPSAGSSDDAFGPRWDPSALPQAPRRPSVLPERLAPLALPPNVADAPIDAAVVAWPEPGHDLRLLSTDGEWRCVKGTANAVAGTLGGVVEPTLSSDGKQVAMSTNDGLLVVDVTTGDEQLIPWPAPLAPPWDDPPSVEWLPDGEGFYVATWPHGWFLGHDGSAERAPFGRRYAGGVAIDPDGTIVEKRYAHYDLRVWRDGEVIRTVPVGNWGERLAAAHGRLALTGGGSGLPVDGGPLVLDAETGEVVAYRPIRDPHATYSDNGHLTALGFLDPETVVYLVGPAERVDRRLVVDAWHLVTWDLETLEFERLTSGGEGMRTIDVAVGALGA